MVSIKLTQNAEQVRKANELVDKKFTGERGLFDGSKIKKFVGTLGEIIIADWLGVKRPSEDAGFDGGYDIDWRGKRWDVKVLVIASDFKPQTHCFNVYGAQAKYDNDGYIFLSYNKSKGFFELIGFIRKEDFLRKAIYFPAGSKMKKPNGEELTIIGGNYEVKKSMLEVFDFKHYKGGKKP